MKKPRKPLVPVTDRVEYGRLRQPRLTDDEAAVYACVRSEPVTPTTIAHRLGWTRLDGNGHPRACRLRVEAATNALSKLGLIELCGDDNGRTRTRYVRRTR